MKKSVQSEKTAKLYSYFLQNGFDHSIEEIAAGIGISPKTIFNRYQNREKMEELVMRYWHELFARRYEEKRKNCNNAIEGLLLFVYEVKQCYANEKYLVQKKLVKDPLVIEEDDSFFHALKIVLHQGIEENYFRNEIDSDLYAHFFLFNISRFFLNKQNKTDVIEYLLVPVLKENGAKVLQTINIGYFLA